MNLSKGANHVLTRSGTIHVYLGWKAPAVSMDAVCFAVMANGSVLSDDWFLFYNQKVSPENAIEIVHLDQGRAEFVVHTDRLPSGVQKCVFATALEESSFREVAHASITATPSAGEALNFRVTDVADEQALIFAEIYRHGPGWKMRAIGQGFTGGLQALAEHYGVKIEDEPTASPVPPVADGDLGPAPPPLPPVSTGGLFGFLKITLFAMLFIGIIAGLGYYYFSIKAPSPSIKPSITTHSTREYIEPTCTLTNEQVFKRYHTLGENYVKITKIIDVSNRKLAGFREELRAIESDCPRAFIEKNEKQIDILGKLPIQGWVEETIRLNTCAGLMNKKISIDLEYESRPTVIKRLLKNVDRSRNLESDLTNISRDLAYLGNKRNRLVEGYKSNLAACSM